MEPPRAALISEVVPRGVSTDACLLYKSPLLTALRLIATVKASCPNNSQDDHTVPQRQGHSQGLLEQSVCLRRGDRQGCSVQDDRRVPADQDLLRPLEGREPELCSGEEARNHHHGRSGRRCVQNRRPEGRTAEPERAARLHPESGPGQLQDSLPQHPGGHGHLVP